MSSFVLIAAVISWAYIPGSAKCHLRYSRKVTWDLIVQYCASMQLWFAAYRVLKWMNLYK